jgi:hypothetical protein
MDPNLPIHLTSIQVKGNERIKNEFFASTFREVSNSHATSTLTGVATSLPKLHEALKGTGKQITFMAK